MVALALASCGKDAVTTKPAEGECSLSTPCARGDAPARDEGHGATASWPTTAPVLPGVIYFRSERGMERIADGRRELVAADLYPSASRVGPDLVALRSKGDGSPQAEQLVIGARAVGFAAAQVRDPAVDPAGAWIVVAAMRDGHSDLYRIDTATGADTRLTSNVEGNFAPAVLDPETIVFASSRDGDSELYRMPVAGGEATRLTAFHRDDWAPTPSPDGRRIAFVSDREGTPRIFVMSARGTDLQRLTKREDGSEESEPAWSPDGTSIAYVVQPRGGATAGPSEVVVHELASGTELHVTPPATSTASSPTDVSPTFSPDGAYLLVSRQPPPSERVTDGPTPAPRDRPGATFDLWVIPLRGGAPVQLTNDPGNEQIPRWLRAGSTRAGRD